MVNKISNIATREDIEHALQVKFDYAPIYNAAVLIDGFKESNVAVITSEKPERIQFGIWGILPQDYSGDWKHFQENFNTLETPISTLTKGNWLHDAFQHRRCLIIATGYFTAVIKNNILFPYFNKIKNETIFCFAGIYNVLEDGFITVSIVSDPEKSSDEINPVLNKFWTH